MKLSKVSQRFLSHPTVRARAVVCAALGVQLKMTHLAFDNVLLLIGVLLAPMSEIVVNERTRPFVSMRLIMP